MTPEDAEEYTEALAQTGAGWWRQIALGAKLGVPQELGLSLDEWRTERLGGLVLKSIPERREAIQELVGTDGFSNREAAAILGVDEKTVRNDLRAENSALQVDEPQVETLPAADDAENSAPQESETLPVGQERAESILAQIDDQLADQAAVDAVSEAIERHLPPDPDDQYREWRRAFLSALGQGRRAMQFDIEDAASRADDECIDELQRLASDITSYTTRVVAARPRPDNVRHLKAI